MDGILFLNILYHPLSLIPLKIIIQSPFGPIKDLSQGVNPLTGMFFTNLYNCFIYSSGVKVIIFPSSLSILHFIIRIQGSKYNTLYYSS